MILNILKGLPVSTTVLPNGVTILIENEKTKLYVLEMIILLNPIILAVVLALANAKPEMDPQTPTDLPVLMVITHSRQTPLLVLQLVHKRTTERIVIKHVRDDMISVERAMVQISIIARDVIWLIQLYLAITNEYVLTNM